MYFRTVSNHELHLLRPLLHNAPHRNHPFTTFLAHVKPGSHPCVKYFAHTSLTAYDVFKNTFISKELRSFLLADGPMAWRLRRSSTE